MLYIKKPKTTRKYLIGANSIGKTDMLGEEKLDCAVRALANATGKSYETCHMVFDRAGRKDNCATLMGIVANVYASHGFTLAIYGTSNAARYCRVMSRGFTSHAQAQTIATLLKSGKYDKGVFIFGTVNHVFAVVDGAIVDTGGNYSTTSIINIYTKAE